MGYYSVIQKKEIGSFVVTWLNLEPIIQSEVSQKEKDKYHILMYIWNKNGIEEFTYRAALEKQT